MNRKILFRGKDLETGKWLYGSFIKTPNHAHISTSGEAFPAKVEPKTISQYTGLTDKNGTKIFEGDVLHFGDKNYLVFWNDECFQWQMKIRKDGFSFPIYSGQDTGCPVECITLSWVAAEIPILGTMSTEIVGNIYDNSELIAPAKKNENEVK